MKMYADKLYIYMSKFTKLFTRTKNVYHCQKLKLNRLYSNFIFLSVRSKLSFYVIFTYTY